MIIIVRLPGRDGDFWTLEDEAISCADVFIEFAFGKTNRFEEVA